MAVRSAVINVMSAAARKAGRGLIRDFGEVENLQVSQKGPSDFVSTADLKAEKTLRNELEKARPGYGFLMEESAPVPGDGKHRWIVDPLDGTLNFLHGIPHFCISVALERDGEIIAGVVYEPLRDEEYWAEKGSGAFVSDRRLRVSGRRNLSEAVIATGIPFGAKRDNPIYPKMLNAVAAETAGIRRFGSAALDLAYVAAGKFDGFWEFALNSWDIAAGILLVREAGGYVTDFDGGHDVMKSGNVFAANDHLHLPLGRILRQATKA
jgi:myo-inositol-1(or 4)-monophosphatase